jgi:hypothetical protein
VVLLLVLGGLSAARGGVPARATAELAGFAATAELVKGHLLSSQELYAGRHEAWAAIHAAHPVQELWSLLQGPLAQASPELASRLGGLLERPGRELDARVAEPRYRGTLAQVTATLDEAVARVVPAAVRGSLAFRARVVIEVLRHVPEEYAEAVEGGKVTQAIEYQDAYGFFRRARALYEPIAGDVRARDGRAAREIDGAWLTLGKAFAGVMPPARPLSPGKIEDDVREIVIELGKVTGVQVARSGGAVEEIRLTRAGVQQALEAYRGGQVGKAEELVSAAYLDHFEKAEAPLQRKDRALEERLERLIRTDLRGKIKARAPVGEVEQLVTTISGALEQAERLLAGS